MNTQKHLVKDIEFDSNGLKLSGVFFYPPIQKNKYPAILFVNGWTNKKHNSYQYAKSLSKLGFLCFLFDMRNHSKNNANRNMLSNKDFLDDVLIAYDLLHSMDEVDKENISAIGLSFGGYLVTLLSSKRKLINIVLQVPADYPNELFESPVKLSSDKNPEVAKWRKQRKTHKESSALEAIHNFNGDILIIESELDNVIPHQTIKSYLDCINDKKKLRYVIMKGAPHISKRREFKNEVEKIKVDWFKTRI